jgi:alpha-N-arabinofuranosidase
MKATMAIDRDFKEAKIDERLYGSFIEHIGRAVYGGIYEPGHPSADASGFRGDVISLARQLNLPLVRYPGGNFLSGYDWLDGVGPREKRPQKLDLAWRSLESNQFGTDEFMRWAKLAGTQPMMAVNLGTRGAEHAAALVEYCNHPGGSRYSDLRRANGHADPYGIKQWCLGNEMDGPWQLCSMEPKEYALKARETAKMMKLVDPSIELVACGSSNFHMPTMGQWEQTVLETCYPHVDYISMHIYIDNREDDTPLYLAKPLEMERFIRTITSVCDYVGGKLHSRKQIHISFDEWNVAYHSNERDAKQPPWRSAPPIGEDVYNFQDALAAGLMLITLIRSAGRVKIACLAQLVNVIAAIMTETGGPAWRQTIYYPFWHASLFGRGELLHSALRCPDYSAGDFEDVPYVDAVATCDEANETLTVFAVNRSEREAADFSLSLRGYDGYRAGEHIAYSCSDKYACNTREHPDRAVPVTLHDLTMVGESARAALPPLSWNVLRFHRPQ